MYFNSMLVGVEVNLYSEQWLNLKAHTGRNPAILDCFDWKTLSNMIQENYSNLEVIALAV